MVIINVESEEPVERWEFEVKPDNENWELSPKIRHISCNKLLNKFQFLFYKSEEQRRKHRPTSKVFKYGTEKDPGTNCQNHAANYNHFLKNQIQKSLFENK